MLLYSIGSSSLLAGSIQITQNQRDCARAIFYESMLNF